MMRTISDHGDYDCCWSPRERNPNPNDDEMMVIVGEIMVIVGEIMVILGEMMVIVVCHQKRGTPIRMRMK